MFNSEDEFIMEFKAEERIAQPEVIGSIEYIDSDASTISASEADSDNYNTRIPPLFCKLKKPRVLIKKLPREVLAKYKLNSKKTPLSYSPQPSRTSGRIKDKRIPAGQYLSLHVNKPLHEVLNKKKMLLRLHQMKTVKKETQIKEKKKSQNKNTSSFKKKPNKNLNDNKVSARTLPNLFNGNSKAGGALNCQSLQERIAATRLRNHPAVPALPNLPDVVITKYNMPPNQLLNTINTFVLNETSSNISLRTVQQGNLNVSTTPTKNTQVPLPIGATSLLHRQTAQSSRVFPTFITPASQQQIPFQPVVLKAATVASGAGLHQPDNTTPRTFTIQAFKIPHDLSIVKSTGVVNSPKVLIINQPSLETDPLDMPSYSAVNRRDPVSQQISKETNTRPDIECVDSESDLEVSDTEKETEPEVVKRIIYHNKSVQTKFTCSSSICGLVDSDGFNLNCFYCYDIFPLHKWSEFKEHIKLLHRVEEKAIESDVDISNSNTNYYSQVTSCQDFNVSKNMHTPSKSISNKENFVRKSINDTDKIYKKLPLEPRLAAQRMSEASRDAAKQTSSTLKGSTQPSKQLNRSIVSGKSCRTELWKDLSNSCNDEVINLDSEDDDLDTNNVSEVSNASRECAEANKTNNQSKLNSRVSRINDVKLVVPSLPHIAIKKVDRLVLKEPLNTKKSTSNSPSLKKNLMKTTSNMNIQRVIKSLSNPELQKLSANDSVKPRFFVVKRIIKLPKPDDAVPNLNISKGTTTPKMPKTLPEKHDVLNIDHMDMPSNDENEDSVPKPTNGCGILFGVTNSMVVIEFLLKLKTFPELWRPQSKNNSSVICNESITKLCRHLNNRFELNITEYEIRLSIQRVKKWYRRMLAKIYEHNKNPNNSEPYKHKFPIYFKILQSFLASNGKYAKTASLSSKFQSNTTSKKKEITCAPVRNQKISILDERVSKADNSKYQAASTVTKETENITMSSGTPPVDPTAIDNNQTTEMNMESLIEFDPDTLYDNESSDEEILEEFDETKNTKKRRTKTYFGRFECDICPKVFKRRCDLVRHKVMHFPPQFECGICTQKFYFKHWAERCSHIRNKKYKADNDNSADVHWPKKIWPKKIFRFKMICEICGASYRSIGALNTHKKDKHLNERHKCVVCNFTALSNWRILQHQRKRHIVEFGTIEEIAKKTRARTETKTRFSDEARKEFLWRREMRMKLKPGEIFYGCCKCRIVFSSRKEKVLHNKIEHPITETTVICLFCLPNKLLLSNSNCARRHYTDIHKVAWHEIDALVKRTKPIFNLLSKEEIELLKGADNYKELLEELLKDKKLEPFKTILKLEQETVKAVQNLTTSSDIKEEFIKIDGECSQEDNVCVDGIIDHDYDCEEMFNDQEYANGGGHIGNEEKEFIENFEVCDEIVNNSQAKTELYSSIHTDVAGIVQLAYDIESSDNKTHNYVHNDHEYTQSIDYLVEEEFVEESIVIEEYIDEVVEQEESF